MNRKYDLVGLSIQRLISLALVLLMVHPALMPEPAPKNRRAVPTRSATQKPIEVAARSPILTPLVPRRITTKIARQIPLPLPGQSQTLLPDGRTLRIGGVSASGVVSSALLQGIRLAASLSEARAWHTATVLPDGTVRIFGGIDGNGIVANPESFDILTQQLQPAAMDLAPRAYHTATVLTDGRLLVAGGIDSGGAVLNRLEVWDPRTGKSETLLAQLTIARRGDTARLQSDGSVLFQGGIKADGTRAEYDELLLADASGVVSTPNPPDSPSGFQVAASIPADGGQDVTLDGWIAMRFTRPANVTTVNASTTTLQSDTPTAARVIPAEDGMLVFVVPQQLLETGTSYTVRLSGVQDTGGFPLPLTEIQFTTGQAAGTPVAATPTNGSKSALQPKDAGQKKEDPPAPPLQGPVGITSLSGTIRNHDAKYLPGVTVNLDCSGKVATTKTDPQGRFLITNLTSGHCVLETNGSTAQDPGNTHGRFFQGVDLIVGRTNFLPFTIFMTPVDQAGQKTIVTNSGGEQVITNPNIKGLELHLPPNTLIRGNEGEVITQLNLTRVPAGRTPFPMPKGVAFGTYFTIQPAGAYVEVGGSRYTPGKGATLVYPNVYRAPAGTVFNFWDYDPDGRGWYIYGTGKVTSDRKSIVPDPGTVVGRFVAAMVAPRQPYVPARPGAPPSKGGGGELPGIPTCPPWPPCQDCGDPIQPSTGLFSLTQVDLSVSDVLSIQVTRTYRTGDPLSRAFGIGATHPYDMFLVGDTLPYTFMDLVLPDSSLIHFPRISPGTSWTDAVYQHTTTASSFYGSTIRWNGNGWTLQLKNGTTFVFPDSSNQTILAKMGVLKIADRFGNALTTTRNSSTVNLLKVTSPNGRWVAFTYDSANRITQAQDQTGRTVAYSYDPEGRLVTVTNPLGGTSQYTYDANNQMLTSVDPRGHTLANVYDTEGHVIQQTAEDGGIWHFAYTENSSGDIIQTDITNRRGYVHRLTFDTSGYFSGGRTVSETLALNQPEQQVATYQWDPNTGLLQSMLDQLNRTTSFTYDSVANVASVTFLSGTPNAATTNYTYDPVSSNVASTTDPLGHQTTISYNSLGELQQITDATGRIVNMAYNSSGQVISKTSAAGTSKVEYTNGLPSGTVDLGGNRSTLTTDPLGRVIAASDPLGQTASFQYDPLNRIVVQTDPLQSQTQFGYDPNGNLLTLTDALNHTTSYTYDPMDRALTRTDPLNATESFTYDYNGNLTQKTDRKHQVTQMTYDSLDRPKVVTFADSSTITKTYDAGNRLTQVVDSANGTIIRTYDGMNRLLTEATPQGSVTYTYDGAGRRATFQVTGQPQISYTYDNANRLTQITQGSTTVSIAYDNVGRRSSLTLANGAVVTYAYDAASRLAGITATKGSQTIGNLTYGYDAVSRRTTVGGSLANVSLPAALSSATYNASNELLQLGSTTLTYDANGNLTNDGTNTYTWNARNQLASMTGASFQYNAMGRRANKTVGGTSMGFLYDGINVVQELSGSSPRANLLTGLGVDEVFQRTDSGGTMSLLTDGLNSTVALLDSSGNMPTQYTYDPYGGTTQTGSTNGNSAQFTSRENDGTGLYYNRARFYSPAIGRFISEDPAGLGGGINLYAYVGGSPTNFIDPFGLEPQPHPPGPDLPDLPDPGNTPPGNPPGPQLTRGDDTPWYQNSCITDALGDAALHIGIDAIGLIPEAGGIARMIGHQAGYVGVVADQTGFKVVDAFGKSTSTAQGLAGLGNTSPEGLLSTGLTIAGFIPGLGQLASGASIVVDVVRTGMKIAQCR